MDFVCGVVCLYNVFRKKQDSSDRVWVVAFIDLYSCDHHYQRKAKCIYGLIEGSLNDPDFTVNSVAKTPRRKLFLSEFVDDKDKDNSLQTEKQITGAIPIIIKVKTASAFGSIYIGELIDFYDYGYELLEELVGALTV